MKGKRSTWFFLSYVSTPLLLILSLSASTVLAAPTHSTPSTHPGFGLRSVRPHTYHVNPIVHHIVPVVRHVTPQTRGAITEYSLPYNTPYGYPNWITSGPDGNLWFTDYCYYSCYNTNYDAYVVMLTPGGTFTYYTLPEPNNSISLEGITAGPDGNLWFTEQNTNRVGMVTPSGTFAEYTIPLSSYPYAITAGPDGNLWFTDTQQQAIWSISPGGTFTVYPLPDLYSYPYGITAGPQGTNTLWFTVAGGGSPPVVTPSKIGSINVSSGQITEYTIPGKKYKYPYPYSPSPWSITLGPNGTLWFTEAGVGKIGVIDSKTGKITQYQIPTYRSSPMGIALGADGQLWFTENAWGKIGSSSSSGTMTEYRLPSVGSRPQGITAGLLSSLWFTEQGTNKIGSITTS